MSNIIGNLSTSGGFTFIHDFKKDKRKIEMAFPQAKANQAYVKVSALDAGELTLQEKFFITDPAPGAKNTVPSLSFLIQHPAGTNIVFDGGLRHTPDDYKPSTAQRIRNSLSPYIVKTDAADFLKNAGFDPTQVNVVMLSHVHYDHIGSPKTFPRAKYVVGAGSVKTMKGGYPGYEDSLFEADLFANHEVVELPPFSTSSDKNAVSEQLTSHDPNHVWHSLAHFPAALDYFGDGSLFVIDAPGHMEGHINVLARIGPQKWVYLGGDACHDPRILTGEKGIAVYQDIHGQNRCAHGKKEVADETVARIRVLTQPRNDGEKIEVVLAHDYGWYAQNRSRFYPTSL